MGAFLTAILMSFAGRVFTALGVSFVSYKGLDALQSKFLQWVGNSLNSVPADALNLFYLAGGGIFLNWLFGAYAFVVAAKSVGFLASVLKK